MIASERRAVFSLSLLYSLRMLGLFMILPVFVIYGADLKHASGVLLGVAIGAYGLSQAMFQIPFGALSDRYGRKKLIFLGLLLFLIGSVVAALSDDIYGVILGRFLQGSGAIASVLMALLSDLTSEENRTKSMALIGMSIGISFSIALIVGPLISSAFGIKGIFWITALLAAFGMLWLLVFVPSPVHKVSDRNTRLFGSQLKDVLANVELLRLDFGIFALHLCLTAVFIALPMSLQEKAGLVTEEHWWIYLTVLVSSFFAMIPFIIIGEKKQKMKQVFVFAVSLLSLSAFSFIFTQYELTSFWLSLFFFFMAFNLLEAILPSLVSKLSPAGNKGTAMGVYSTSQFMGAFVGGTLGGVMLTMFHESGVYVLVASVCFLWVIVAKSMQKPNHETGMTLQFTKIDQDSAQIISTRLSSVPGVEEVVVIPQDGVAYLKVIKSELNLKQLDDVMDCFKEA